MFVSLPVRDDTDRITSILPGQTIVVGRAAIGEDALRFDGSAGFASFDFNIAALGGSFMEGFGADGFARIEGFENLIGSDMADLLQGDDWPNRIDGEGGNDWIEALGGDDIIDAGAGRNWSFGGSGDDSFIYRESVALGDQQSYDGGEGNDTLFVFLDPIFSLGGGLTLQDLQIDATSVENVVFAAEVGGSEDVRLTAAGDSLIFDSNRQYIRAKGEIADVGDGLSNSSILSAEGDHLLTIEPLGHFDARFTLTELESGNAASLEREILIGRFVFTVATPSDDGSALVFTNVSGAPLPQFGGSALIEVVDLESGTSSEFAIRQTPFGRLEPDITPSADFLAVTSMIDPVVEEGGETAVNQVYVIDVANRTSYTPIAAAGADGLSDGASDQAVLSDDGNSVVFRSSASNWVADDGNDLADIFLWQRDMDTLTRVSDAMDGGDADGASFDPAISGDGRFVAFRSEAGNLPGDVGDSESAIYLYDVLEDTTTLVSELASPFVVGTSLDFDGNTLAFNDGEFVKIVDLDALLTPAADLV